MRKLTSILALITAQSFMATNAFKNSNSLSQMSNGGNLASERNSAVGSGGVYSSNLGGANFNL